MALGRQIVEGTGYAGAMSREAEYIQRAQNRMQEDEW